MQAHMKFELALTKGHVLEVILITRIVKIDNSSLSAICEKILNT